MYTEEGGKMFTKLHAVKKYFEPFVETSFTLVCIINSTLQELFCTSCTIKDTEFSQNVFIHVFVFNMHISMHSANRCIFIKQLFFSVQQR